MPTYKKGDEKDYLPTVLAALVIIAVLVASFIFSLVKGDTGTLEKDLLQVEDGVSFMNPDESMNVPSGPPILAEPTTPPPIN